MLAVWRPAIIIKQKSIGNKPLRLIFLGKNSKKYCLYQSDYHETQTGESSQVILGQLSHFGGIEDKYISSLNEF